MEGNERKVEQHELDRWLDSTLRARVDAEPRAGLEDRVLARLATEPYGTGFAWWRMVSVAAALLVVVAGVLMLRVHQQEPVRQALQASAPAVPAVVQPSAVEPLAVSRQKRHGGTRLARGPASKVNAMRQLPRLGNFPASVPQTEQERLLVTLARGADARNLATFPETLVPLKDIEIGSLRIEPLSNDEVSARHF